MAILNKYFLLLPIVALLSCNRSAFAQKFTKSDFKQETSYSNIWIPSEKEEVFQYKIKDTAKHSLSITFEQEFNDSLAITVNEKVVYAKRIKTDPNFSATKDAFEIDYSRYSDIPTISIYLIERKVFVDFKPKQGYRTAYINRLQDGPWEIAFSNFPRFYY